MKEPPMRIHDAELVVFDPQDEDTYPSVCQSPEEVKRRFGFTGGEVLLFDAQGNYRGQLVNRLLYEDDEIRRMQMGIVPADIVCSRCTLQPDGTVELCDRSQDEWERRCHEAGV